MAGKTVEKDAAVKVARQRLSVLELAETLGNISEACRRGGMDRTSFYEWKRRFQTHGLEGLKDMPPIPKSQPNQRYCQEFFAKTKSRLIAGSYPATKSDSAEPATSRCFMLM